MIGEGESEKRSLGLQSADPTSRSREKQDKNIRN